jgi:hypothetical protein
MHHQSTYFASLVLLDSLGTGGKIGNGGAYKPRFDGISYQHGNSKSANELSDNNIRKGVCAE